MSLMLPSAAPSPRSSRASPRLSSRKPRVVSGGVSPRSQTAYVSTRFQVKLLSLIAVNLLYANVCACICYCIQTAGSYSWNIVDYTPNTCTICESVKILIYINPGLPSFLYELGHKVYVSVCYSIVCTCCG